MLSLTDVNFSYSQHTVLQSISFSVKPGKLVALIGKSGAGKSTLLSLIHGNLQPDSGKILWKNEKIHDPSRHLVAQHKYIKYLTQEFNVMPYTTVSENIKEHLSRMFAKQNEDICQRLLKVVNLQDFADVKVKLLSGGQKQRVALAKVLAKKPELLLLDEPFSHIDVLQRNQLRRNLFAYLKEEKITCVFATHDPDDFLSFADNCLVVQAGKLVDYRPMQEMYNSPKSIVTASLLGEVNKVSATVLQWDEKFPKASFLVYPHEIHLAKNSSVEVEIVANYFKGSHFLVEANCFNQQLFFYHPSALPKNSRQKIGFNFPIEQRKITLTSP
ncbi:MAG: ABC transporter ATP-binding protein [Flavobacteriaceae bacterium]|nr:ABC transporter ATP-binding protein [Flavobacteriaceae bacterium]